MLVCHICAKKAGYKLIIDSERYTNNLYFCKIHKPFDMKLKEMDDEQCTEGTKIVLNSSNVQNTHSEVKE